MDNIMHVCVLSIIYFDYIAKYIRIMIFPVIPNVRNDVKSVVISMRFKYGFTFTFGNS